MGLREAGIWPELVVTDASSLYPRVIQEVWPEAEHQLCVFHFIMGTNKRLAKVFWALYRSMPEAKKRKRGRPKCSVACPEASLVTRSMAPALGSSDAFQARGC